MINHMSPAEPSCESLISDQSTSTPGEQSHDHFMSVLRVVCVRLIIPHQV